MNLEIFPTEVSPLTPLLKVEQVARTLNVSLSFVYQLLASGEIPVVRFGRACRVRSEDLQAYIQKNTYKQNAKN